MADESGGEVWVDPFPKRGDDVSLWPKLIRDATDREQLSRTVLEMIEFLQQMGGSEWNSIKDKAVCFCRQSYELACQVDQYYLAAKGIELLAKEANKESAKGIATNSLRGLAASKGDDAKIRVALYSRKLCGKQFWQKNKPNETSDEECRRIVLRDFRHAIITRDRDFANLVLRNAQYEGSLAKDSVEFQYLASEYHIWLCNFYLVLSQVEPYGAKFNDPNSEYYKHRGLMSCLARALEATGQLDRAKKLYEELERKEKAKVRRNVERLKTYTAGACHWNFGGFDDQSQLVPPNQQLVGARLLSLPPSVERRAQAFFLFTKLESCDPNHKLQFFGYTVLRWEGEDGFAGEFQHSRLELPENSTTWVNMIVVSDVGSEPLGILVDAVVAPGKTVMQLWQCIQNRWREITILGNTPNAIKALLSRDRAQCKRVGHEIFLIDTTEGSQTTGTIYMYSLLSYRWRKVQRPDGAVKPVAQTTPVNGAAVALLSTDISFVNEKLDNECVPKVSLGIFEPGPPLYQNSSTSQHGSWFWSQDVATQDQSGYIFKGKQGSVVQTSNLLLVLGFGVPDTIMKAGGRVVEEQDIDVEVRTKPTLDALDLSSLTWRGLQVDNSWVIYPYFDRAIMLNGGDSNTLLLITSNSSGDFRVYSLRNSHMLEKCYTKKVKQNRLDAEKRSLSHQIQAAEKARFKSYLGCSWCSSLEVESVPKFLTCGRCGDPNLSYCSKACQLNHWNEEHKDKCKESHKDVT